MADAEHEWARDVWAAWYNDELNWQNLPLDPLDDDAPPNVDTHKDPDTGEVIDQDWPLRDPSMFYYPLFGLGQPNSDIAVVATGPGHNIEAPWTNCYEGQKNSRYRERFEGPPAKAKRGNWFGSADQSTPPKEKYYNPGFKYQKDDWIAVRQGKKETDTTDMVEALEDLRDELPDDLLPNSGEPNPDASVFDTLYYTNFMKDGEYDKDGADAYDLASVEELPDPSDGTNAQTHPSPLIRPRWSDIGDNLENEREVCEVASREFWLPVLGAELADVNPKIIIPMGKKATRGVFQLYATAEDYEPPDWSAFKEVVFYPETPPGGPTIIPSYHWSWLEQNRRHLKDRYPNMTNNQDYWEELAAIIDNHRPESS